MTENVRRKKIDKKSYRLPCIVAKGRKQPKFGTIIGNNIARIDINLNMNFTFENLQKSFVGPGSIAGFINMISDIDMRVEYQYKLLKNLTLDDKFYTTENLLHYIEKI